MGRGTSYLTIAVPNSEPQRCGQPNPPMPHSLPPTSTVMSSSLTATKVWCSGVGFCAHALVTADMDGGQQGLFSVILTEPAVKPLPSSWWHPGMAGSDTRSVQFTNAPAVAIGGPGDYWNRPGFWHSAIGVAVSWLGGARRVADPLYCCASSQSADAYVLAHLGAVDAALAAGDAMLAAAATHIDADPFDQAGTVQLLSRRTRAIVEYAVDEGITRTGRALGAGPLCQDSRHAQRVADLSIYIRQSHAERDLAKLGRLAGERCRECGDNRAGHQLVNGGARG